MNHQFNSILTLRARTQGYLLYQMLQKWGYSMNWTGLNYVGM